MGQVKKPGKYLATLQLDVVQPLNRASRLKPQANGSIIKIRRRDKGWQLALLFNNSDIQIGLNLEAKILPHSGDIVIVQGEFSDSNSCTD
jgi:protein involved in polysaccharide export with SLBB domain